MRSSPSCGSVACLELARGPFGGSSTDSDPAGERWTPGRGELDAAAGNGVPRGAGIPELKDRVA